MHSTPAVAGVKVLEEPVTVLQIVSDVNPVKVVVATHMFSAFVAHGETTLQSVVSVGFPHPLA